MDRALVRLPPLSLDPKRIAASSGAIALHVLVLLLLLLPSRTSPPIPEVDNPMTVVVPAVKPREIKVVPFVPMPRRPPLPTSRPSPPQPMPDAAPVDATPSDVDTYSPPVDTTPATSFDPGPAAPRFEQLSADVAPPPPYPPQALRRDISGIVMLRVSVDAQGRPTAVSIEQSSGSALLDQAARKFVLARWHFVPATRDGAPIAAMALVPIDFVIER